MGNTNKYGATISHIITDHVYISYVCYLSVTYVNKWHKCVFYHLSVDKHIFINV